MKYNLSATVLKNMGEEEEEEDFGAEGTEGAMQSSEPWSRWQILVTNHSEQV